MSILRTARRSSHVRLHSGADQSGYAPNQIGTWVATNDRDLPWNTIGKALEGTKGKGKKVDGLMTAKDVLAATGMDRINVRKFPLKDAESGTTLDRLFATGYDDPDTNERVYFAAVSDRYELVNPLEGLEFFDAVVNARDGANFSAGWVMKEKSMMGLTIELPEAIVVDPNGAADEVRMHILGYNSFGGETGIVGAAQATRWWCMNQTSPRLHGHKRSFSLRHTKNVKSRTAEAAALLGVVDDYMVALDKVATKLFEVKMTDNQFEKFIARLQPFHLDAGATDLITARVNTRREEAMEAWRAPHNGNITGTRWGALNVVSEFIEWGRNVKGSARTGTDPVRQRAIGTLVHPSVTGLVDEATEILLAR